MRAQDRNHRIEGPPLATAGAGRGALHLLSALGAWALFAGFWARVFLRTPSADGAAGVLAVAALLVISVSLTAAWVRHNVLLSRRFARRRTRVREADPDWSTDVLGRPVAGPAWEELQSAPEVEIDLERGTGRKLYRAF